MSQQEKGKLNFCWTSMHKKKRFSCAFYAYSQSLCSLARFNFANRGVHQPIKPHTYARLLVLDETAQSHFAVANWSDVVMSVFYSPVLTRSLIFLQL